MTRRDRQTGALALPVCLPERAAAYVRARQCRDGGFCFYRSPELEEPNLADTWRALACLQLLGQAIPEPSSVAGWLDARLAAARQAEPLYYLAFSRRMLQPGWLPGTDMQKHIDALALKPPAHSGNLSGWLAAQLRLVRLKAAFGRLEPAPAGVAWLKPAGSGGFGGKPNLLDTALALTLLAMLGTPETSTPTRQFVHDLQSPLAGFRNTLDSSVSRLETLLAGVESCWLLGLPVLYPTRILDAVIMAQRDDGAFADVPGALPNLDSHLRALILLTKLGALPAVAYPLTSTGLFP